MRQDIKSGGLSRTSYDHNIWPESGMVAQIISKGRTWRYRNGWTKAQQIVAVGTSQVRVKSMGCEVHEITGQIASACWSLRAWNFTLSNMEASGGRLWGITWSTLYLKATVILGTGQVQFKKIVQGTTIMAWNTVTTSRLVRRDKTLDAFWRESQRALGI